MSDDPPQPAGHSEDARQLVHIAMGSFALLLLYLRWWQAVILAASAVCFNMWMLRRLTRGRLHRPSELRDGMPTGIVFYPTSVLLLLLLLPGRPDIVAAAWGIMAAGDGAATLVGRRARGPRIPWNRHKSVAGTAAFVIAGGMAGSFLAWWCRPVIVPPPYWWFTFAAPFVGAVAAAAVETVPIRLDDNLSVPSSAALVIWAMSIVSEDLARTAFLGAGPLAVAVVCNAVVAVGGYALRTVSISGAVGGAIIGTTIFFFAGWRGWVLLLATFAAASLTSRMGLRRKTLLGIAEAREGRRGAGNAIANTGIAAGAAVLSAVTYAHDAALIAFAAALVAGSSDTISSEIGKGWGRRTWLIAPVRRVPPGTSGALSIEGTAAGLAGAFALGTAAVVLGIVPASALVPIVAGATIGSFIESGLGATLEAPGILNNDALNFINTGVAAFATLVISGSM